MRLSTRKLLIPLFLVFSLPLQAQTDPWADVIARVSDSVVSLQVSQLRDFDHAEQGVGGATGFIVDAENGIILTNRHVIGAGPVRATATFQNQERLDLVPLYRDPVHDFGFFRYNPGQLKYLQPKALILRPDKIRTGMNIRVIGSDGGEQLSILAGTIARIDRKAPNYGRYEYNDFNTFYFQAASSTSGGSSGSPVLDADGDVVALNAAANSRTASSFFLPLDPVKRALELLQNKQSIPRGTLQTLFDHRSFRELRTLGLDDQTESKVRQSAKANTGMLFVTQVLPGGVAAGTLREGDILVSVNGRVTPNFVTLENTLDALVDKNASLEILRQGKPETLELHVADLHAQIPGRLLEMGDAALQDMSLQHVRGMNLPRRGVVLIKQGYMFQGAGIGENALITHINNRRINTLDDVLALLQDRTSSDSWLVRYIMQGREAFSELARVELDHDWFRYRTCDRRDDTRFWTCNNLQIADALPEDTDDIAPVLPTFNHPLMQKIAPAMVRVDFNIPYIVDNVFSRHFSGTGLVVDAEAGLISIDRNTVPISMGEATVTFFGAYKIPADVVFLHPSNNLALLKYDPQKLRGAAIPALQFADDSDPMPAALFRLAFRQDGTYQINGLDNLNRVTVSMDAPRLPRFQQQALDVYTAANMPPSLGGPVLDADGVIHAIWMSFAYEDGKEVKEAEWALPARVLTETIRSYRQNQAFYAVDVMLEYKSLASAIELGLDNDWLKRFGALDASQRRVLSVEQTMPGTEAATLLSPGDVLLSINGELVTDLLDAEVLSQKPVLELDVLKDGSVQKVILNTSKLSGKGTDRIVSWAGALFQEPHREIALYEGLSVPGVYVADTEPGSPALWDKLYRNRIVTEVNGEAVGNLDDFLARVKEIKADEFTRLTTVSMSGQRDIISVSPEYFFWPTFEIKRADGRWRRSDFAQFD